MNKYLKYLLIILGAAVALVLVVIGWGLWSMEAMREQARRDAVTLSASCDTARYVTEQPSVRFSGFEPEEVSRVQFQLLSGGVLTGDTTVAVADGQVRTPYQRFLKTDTVVVTLRGGQRYFISGYRHEAYLHYGMFGYVGSHDCRLADECFVNGRRSYGAIEKDTI